MKTLKLYILSAMLTVMALGCYAEEYLPILENGKSWIVVLFGNDLDDVYGYREISVNRDVKIAGRDCKEIEITEIGKCWWDESTLGYVQSAFMVETRYAYEEKGNLYTINPIDGKSSFIFGINKDWEADPYGLKYTFEGDMISTIQNVAGKDRRCLWCPYSIKSNLQPWVVEGIGPSYDFWMVAQPSSVANVFHSAVLECRMNDEVIMTAEDFAALRAPGSNAVEALPTEPEGMNDRGASFDLQGRPVTNPVPGTIQVTSDNRKILTR